MNEQQLERFYAKYVEDPSRGCLLWQAAKDRTGYPMFVLAKIKRKTVIGRAHRIAYEHWRGPIPEGLDLDHLCRTRNCVNPWHLEPVTRKVNINRGPNANRAKTHCKHGHPFDERNTRILPGGKRECRECRRIFDAAKYRRPKR